MTREEQLEYELSEINYEFKDALGHLKAFDLTEAEMCIERANDAIQRALKVF